MTHLGMRGLTIVTIIAVAALCFFAPVMIGMLRAMSALNGVGSFNGTL